LQGRAAVITGASRGLGRAIALALGSAGASLALVARSRPALEQTAQACAPVRCVVLEKDLTGPRAASDVVEAAQEALGPLHILVHAAAAYFPMQRITQLTDGQIEASVLGGLGVAAGLCRAVVPSMLGERHGRIVVVSSVAASHGAAGSALYAAEKAGLEGLVRALALDHGKHGITANALAVGFCDTERFRERADAEQRQKLAAATALRRIPTPEEVAQVALFLCLPQAGVITGATVQATAGAHLNNLW
jgi:3-oxoacyl-[acyl-carrier protein] reductase